MEISLKEYDWRFMGFYPWVPILSNSLETGLALKGVTDWVPATVPGGVHYDLYRAGIISHPHIDVNSLTCEWVENRWWLYETQLPCPEIQEETVELVCKGLDYRARIYINDELLGIHEGMFHPAVFDITAMVRSADSLKVHILFEHAPDEMGQIGKTSLTHTQKSRFNYKWDFSARLVNIGIWDDITLIINKGARIDELSVTSDVQQEQGVIRVSAVLKDLIIGANPFSTMKWVVKVTDPEGHLVKTEEQSIVSDQLRSDFEIYIDEPLLWFPNGHGSQPLYLVELQLIDQNGFIYDEQTRSIGIRSLDFVSNVDSPEDALPYTVVINGKKVYIKGVNMTPLDLLYGNVTNEQYEWLIYLMKKANMNMVRVWGGGIIEKTVFYDLCDRHGIMIWQEFIQSSSGVDSVPAKSSGFLRALEESAVAAVKERRNHVALTVWSGGNELTDEEGRPASCEDDNIALLKRLVEQHDPSRLFLPTSASGPVEFVTLEKGVSHDVHGNWKYLGSREHYELYGNVDHLFHSEFGVDGMSAFKSIKKYLSAGRLTPRSMNDDLVWRHHGEWWDTFERDENLFGKMSAMNTFIQASQWIQAEGLRYIVEANRRRQFNNSGSIIWQLNEPFPNVSSTSLIDYYGETKMSYYWVRKAFAPLHVSMDYQKLDYKIGEPFSGKVYVHSDCWNDDVQVKAEVLDSFGKGYAEHTFTGKMETEQSICMGEFAFSVADYPNDLFFIRIKATTPSGTIGENVYVFSTKEQQIYSSALQLQEGKLEVTSLTEWEVAPTHLASGSDHMFERIYLVQNTGKEVLLHIYPEETTNDFWIEADWGFESLFPGEGRQVSILCRRKSGGGFLAEDRANKEVEQPSIHFTYLNQD
ncbi:hypothetical protein G4V62_07280 [Bacillaceae bacterium SIJ1]|uniref:glycoside hydrolase family 2 protein n=1 Tax=Litoribacterium kuwaitense TaxID=1398745 RepID=UPI0013EBF91F|nr:glycoside hydrolase family 2 TIM barrel-domain containing protein [Litoribacterium kuwaitense]NGP44768.1 hypothetical protein [Litoribacterium kuwaitense]